MLGSMDLQSGGSDCQENNSVTSPTKAELNKMETKLSVQMDTESEINKFSPNSSGKTSQSDSSLKEMEAMKSEFAGEQIEAQENALDTQIERNSSSHEELITKLEHNPPWSFSSQDLEMGENKNSRDIIRLRLPSETQELDHSVSSMVLQQDKMYSMEVSKTTIVKKSVVGDGVVRVMKDSEVITAVNQAMEDISQSGKYVEEIFEDIRDKNLEESKPSTSISHVQQKPSDVFVRKSFTCDNSTVDEDEELREHWTRTLQTSTSTGEIVEEIVRVLKHQKTHDLLCPVCGSCITKRVVLRKRKRSSQISIDRWYQDHLEEEIQVQDSSTKVLDSAVEQEPGRPMATDGAALNTIAYGCLACFSLFFEKGHHLWSQIEGATELDTISCLPFFFPPYPWGMNRRRKGRPELGQPSPVLGEQVVTTVETRPQVLPLKEDARIKHQTQIPKEEAHPGIDKWDAICGLAPALLPDFRWGSKGSLPVRQDGIVTEIEAEDDHAEQVHWMANGDTVENGELVQQEVHLKGHFKAKADAVMAASKIYKPFKPVGTKFSKQPLQIEEEEKAPTNAIASVASTGYALLEEIPEKSALSSRPSTHVSLFKDQGLLPKFDMPETPDAPKDLAPGKELTQEIDVNVTAIQKSKGKGKPIGWKFPKFLWSVGKVTSEDLTKPLLEDSADWKGKTSISVSEPSKPMKSESLVSVLKIEGPSGDASYIAPLSPAMPELEGVVPQIRPGLKEALRDEVQVVIEVQPSEELQPTTRPVVADTVPVAVPTIQPREGLDIVKSIVYGGLDISVASLGVTSSAAGGDAITRTVVYMGVATLFSGAIGFYHNVINLYYHYQEHYKTAVGKTLMLNGTVAFISYVLFGMLAPVTYGLSFRDSDSRDQKFALCCGVTFVSILILCLGKAYVTNQLFLRTGAAYIFGGFLAAVVGYLTGEHVAELLENWGI